MTSNRPDPIDDAERIRALSHPLRLDLLDFLSEVEEATATDCARHTGESVASCSFHLRTLERHGYIERSSRRGREKPWRIIRAVREFQGSPGDPDSLSATTRLAVTVFSSEVDRIRRYFAAPEVEDPSWHDASAIMRAALWVTPDELEGLQNEVKLLVTKYNDRNVDPSLRPTGARRVRYLGVVNPDPRG